MACQLDHICELPTDRARREALDKLPPTLPGSYERILMRLDDSSEAVRDLVRKALQLIAVRRVEKLGFEEICEALSVSDDSDTLHDDEIVEKYEVLQWCGSLVRTSHEDNIIEFAHYTVQEFLEDVCPTHPKLSAYAISDEKAFDLLGPLCLRYLTLTNYDRVPEATQSGINHIIKRNELHPLYKYAALHWPYFIRHLSNETRTTNLDVLFRIEKSANFCSWAIEIIRQYFSQRSDIYPAPNHFERGSEVAMEIISAVLRPDFTPLHMAAVLGLPDLCTHLVADGANLDIRSKFGTPLHCAIGSFSIFSDVECEEHFESIVRGALQRDFIPAVARRNTAQLLMKAGANPELQFSTPFKSSTILSLPLISSTRMPHFEIVLDLLTAGISVEEEDLQNFRDFYEAPFRTPEDTRRMFNGGVVFSNLLGVLAGSETVPSSQSRLYTSTLRFMNEMKLETQGLSSEVLPAYNASDKEVCAFITSAIERNDVPTLELFLRSSRSERVKLGGLDAEEPYPNWTSLHIAITAGSLDILHLLLRSGCDPNSPAGDGRTPVHLCCRDEHVDALRALLQYGASTVVQDSSLRTIWHRSAEKNSIRVLKVLAELDEKDQALQMVSGMQETPIGITLTEGYRASTLFLLKYCNSMGCWRSPESIFRAAAKFGSSEVIQKLIDIGVELDGTDDSTGNPLHFLCANPSAECINILVGLFPLHQRRPKDDKTPFELILSRGVTKEDGLHKDAWEALFSDASKYSTPYEASILWSFICSNLMPSAVSLSHDLTWLRDLIFFLLQQGVPNLYEEHSKTSAIVPFLSWVFWDLKNRIPMFTNGVRADRYIIHWTWISEILLQLVKETKFWANVAAEPIMVALLSESIMHRDSSMIALLLESGVDVHARVEQLSPLELACFPLVRLTDADFELLAMHCTAEKIVQGNEAFQGHGAIHFTAVHGIVSTSVSKLKHLLQTGVDVNLPMAGNCEPPLLHHISCNSLETVDLLLDFGANPWTTGRDSLDAPLRAVASGNVSLLAKIAAVSQEKGSSTAWNRTWRLLLDRRLFSGGNALHLAACFGQIDCLSFYLDQGLVCNLESTDDDLETPMHYASRFGMASVVELLHRHGGNVNATSRHGLTPLHLATMLQHLNAVQALLKLGAKQIACSSGCVPLVYAYRGGNSYIIDALQTTEGCTGASPSTAHPKGLRIMADLLSAAIRRDDIAACEKTFTLGCPIDVELNQPPGTHALMIAISEQKSLELVEWLLQKGAIVSTVYTKGYSTALEAALAQPAFNSLLPALATQYFDEGGDFLSLHRNPLHVAVNHGNIAGLQILLDTLRQIDLGRDKAM